MARKGFDRRGASKAADDARALQFATWLGNICSPPPVFCRLLLAYFGTQAAQETSQGRFLTAGLLVAAWERAPWHLHCLVGFARRRLLQTAALPAPVGGIGGGHFAPALRPRRLLLLGVPRRRCPHSSSCCADKIQTGGKQRRRRGRREKGRPAPSLLLPSLLPRAGGGARGTPGDPRRETPAPKSQQGAFPKAGDCSLRSAAGAKFLGAVSQLGKKELFAAWTRIKVGGWGCLGMNDQTPACCKGC